MHNGNKLIVNKIVGSYCDETPSYSVCKCSDCKRNFNLTDNQEIEDIKFCPLCGKKFSSQFCFETEYYLYNKIKNIVDYQNVVYYVVESKNNTMKHDWREKRRFENKSEAIDYLNEINAIAIKQMNNPKFPDIVYRLIVRKNGFQIVFHDKKVE